MKLDIPVRPSEDVDGCFLTRLLGEEVFVPCEVVRLDGRFLPAKELRDGYKFGAFAPDMQGKVWVDLSVIVRLGSVNRCLSFDTDIEGLTSYEIGLVLPILASAMSSVRQAQTHRRVDTAQFGAGWGTPESLSRH